MRAASSRRSFGSGRLLRSRIADCGLRTRTVAERAQAFGGLRVRRRGGRQRRRRVAIRARLEIAHDRRLRRREVRLLARILLDVEQLGLRRGDELPRARPDRSERRPAELDERRERFGVQLSRGRAACRRTPATRSMPSTSASGAPSSRMTVGATSASVTASADAGARRDAGAADDQRHAQRGVVDEDAVRVFAVLAERFAVIARRDDQRVCSAPARARRAAGRFRGRPSRSRRRTGRPPAGRRTDRRTARAARRGGPRGRRQVGRVGQVGRWGGGRVVAIRSHAIASSTTCDAGRSFATRPSGPRGMRSPYTSKPRFKPELMVERERGDKRRGPDAARAGAPWPASARPPRRAGRCRASRGRAGSGRSAASRARAASPATAA